VAVCLSVAGVALGCAASGSDIDPGSAVAGPASSSGAGGDPAGTGGSPATGGLGGAGGAGGAETGGAGGVDPCAMGCPAGYFDIDDNPLTGDCGCEYACDKKGDADPIDPNFTDDNCDGSDGVVEECVFVSPTAGTMTGKGTRLDPVDTIAGAIAIAKQNALAGVCLSGESYAGPVAVASGISVYGGFDHLDPDFAFRRSPKVTTTVSAVGTVFYAEKIDLETHIEGIHIVAQTPAAESGESTYGVRLADGLGQLYVRYNTIDAQKGATGKNGAPGTPHAEAQAKKGNNGTNGCEESQNCGFGGPQPSCVEYGGKGGDGGYDSNKGVDGSPGSGNATPGKGGEAADCNPFGGAGNDGTKGGDYTTKGAQGAVGQSGGGLGVLAGGIYVPASGADGKAGKNGKGGSGGGGGGGGATIGPLCYSDKGGGGGSGGCGGLGGDFGRGGTGGGASFGVLAVAGNVVVEDNAITTFGGGIGGKGGDGAAGQLGGPGGTAGGDSDDSGAGGPGGSGSDGGAGGPGGGGGGGPSACLAYATATQSFTKNSCQVGAGGKGGAGGKNGDGGIAPDGGDGATGFTLQITN
jgi:hypothetical protein